MNAYKALNQYNFCKENCSNFEPPYILNNETNTLEPNPNQNVYKHYSTSIYYLLAIFVFFRVATVISLMI